MKKNVPGFIGLFLGLAAFVMIIIAFIPTTPVEGTSLSLYGSTNALLAIIGAGLGLLALIFGIVAVNNKGTKGPRKAGIIIGIFAIIIGLCSTGVLAIMASVTDYANGKENFISEMDAEQRKPVDDLLIKLHEQFPAK